MKAPSLQLGAVVGQGRTAEVYAWGNGQVVKLFRPGFEARVEHELSLAQAGQAVGELTPRLHGPVQIGERPGLVFDRVVGPSLMSALSAKPWRFRGAARELARLHARVHECAAAGLPPLTSALRGLIDDAQLTNRQRDAALDALDTVPEGNRLCHGDLHPGNVLEGRNGLVVIDWGTAGRGDPLLDVSMTALILRLGELPANAPWLLKQLVPVLREHLRREYLDAYSLSAWQRQQVERWQLPLAAARLGRGVRGEREPLLQVIETTLAW